jgi:PAS domain S-box-containing protein
VKIYSRILLNTLPLITVGFLFIGTLTYYLSQNAMSNLAEKWLFTKLTDAMRLAAEDLSVLQKYGLDNIRANVIKAQQHAGKTIQSIALNGGYIWVVTGQGIVVVHPDAGQVGTRVSEEKWFQEISGHRQGKSRLHGRKEKLLTVYSYFEPWRWYILASAPRSELYGDADKMRTYVMVIAFAAVALSAIALMILARRISAPLYHLAGEAQRIGRGDHREVPWLDRGGKMEPGDEIGILSSSFHSMTRQLGRRITRERIISDISRQFVQLSSANVDAAILDALGKIGKYTGADRSYVGEFSIKDRRVGQTHEWCRHGAAPQIDNMVGLCLDDLPWLIGQLEEPGYILVSDVETLPEEARLERQLWRQRGVRSIARVPMIYCGKLRGFFGLDALTYQRDWSREDIDFLQRLAEIFCYTLERQWYQETLAEEKERLEVTLQSIGDGVITTDVEGRVTLINRVGESLTGWQRDAAAGLHIDQVFSVLDSETRERLANPIQDILSAGAHPSAVTTMILVSQDGAERLIASSVSPICKHDGGIIGGVLVFRDITEKRRMQEELLRVEKLESIGVLAGGIAHDFNNILTAIIGNVALTKSDMQPGTLVYAKMGEIEKAAFRARSLTQQLLTFSKGGEPVKRPLFLDRLFHEAAMFALGGSNVGLEFDSPPDLWPVEADEGQIGQVVNNLVINAIQAMPDGGVIYAKLKNVILTAASPLPLVEGRYIMMTVKDFGTGISKENLKRIFDPFFTTKKSGSGLGLATAHSILEKHNGHLTVDSQLGRWTIFTAYLPASDQVVFHSSETADGIVRGAGKILIMDDDETILDVIGALLMNVGYAVTHARDGREMLEFYEKAMSSGGAFDVVILDLTIPGGMGGREAVGRLLQLDPLAKAIVSSGYSNDPVMAEFQSFGFRGAVCKPFRFEDLCRVIDCVLR